MRDKPLVYPPVYIAHLLNETNDLYFPYIQEKDGIQLHYSAQLNSHPHLGTTTSLATASAMGEYLSKQFNVNSKFSPLRGRAPLV